MNKFALPSCLQRDLACGCGCFSVCFVPHIAFSLQLLTAGTNSDVYFLLEECLQTRTSFLFFFHDFIQWGCKTVLAPTEHCDGRVAQSLGKKRNYLSKKRELKKTYPLQDVWPTTAGHRMLGSMPPLARLNSALYIL